MTFARRFFTALAVTLLIGSSAAQEKQSAPARSGGGTEPTYAAVSYGPHARNVMDVWIAPSGKPTPVLVSIHGGAFQNGAKSVGPGLRDLCLKSGISVVAISYRLSRDAIAPAAFHDSARAVQFLRHQAKEWNLDPARIAATGDSAGAGISLWLGLHDDLADPKHADPVLRQSTRLTCVATRVGQTSYDPRFIKQLFPDNPAYKAQWAEKFFGTKLDNLDTLPAEKYQLFEEVSPINHLTRDDPPVLQIYGVPVDSPVTDAIHHPRFGKVLKDKMDALGIPCGLVETVRASENVIFEFVRTNFTRLPAP
ncbi:MAG: alpha/beta hydrolase [Proteobacteria bacterium]|nr:alpha/beta hydrolase [Pseudomonadota bacterium]